MVKRRCVKKYKSGPKAGKCKKFAKKAKNGRRKKSSTKKCTGRVHVKSHSRHCPKR